MATEEKQMDTKEMPDSSKQEIHGGDIYRNQVDYDFSVNINPLGMPRASVRAAIQAIHQAGSYPDWKGEALCRAIADAEGVQAGQVLLGNGAAELIYCMVQALRPACGMVTAPSFQEYEAALCSVGAKVRYWELSEAEDFVLRRDITEAVTQETDILFLCNPHNPTGQLSTKALLEEIAEKCERTKIWLCLDECFLPFLEEEAEYTLKHQLERFPHMVILRAFTKIYGMPGLRLGYALTASKRLLAGMRGCLQPWNTSLPAQFAGLAALKDLSYLERTHDLIREEKCFLLKELSSGLAQKIYAPGANFIFFSARKGLRERLLAERILIRDCSNYRNLGPGYYRIGIRSHEENKELIRRWKKAAGVEKE